MWPGEIYAPFDKASTAKNEGEADEQVKDAKQQPNASLHPDQILPD